MEYIRLILEEENKSFEELAASSQDFTFSYLEKEFSDRIGVHKLDKDILKTLELYSDNNGYNNAAALLADRNTFHGIDIVRFGNSIRVVLPVFSAEEAIGDAENVVIRLLREHGIMSRGQIENETGWKKDHVIRILNVLIEKNIITKIGAARNTKYQLK